MPKETQINGFFEVVNLLDESTMLFGDNVTREAAVAYAHAESTSRLSEYFSLSAEEIVDRFPIIYGNLTLACGDWCAFQEGATLPAKEAS